jgi:vacuolar-type H+-ATPase subunit C/Vma6
MKTSYIYSSSRVKALEKELLSESDVERLLESAQGEKLTQALKETYLSQYMVGESTEDIFNALEKSVTEAKHLISRIVPEPKIFDFLWVRYDLHNLRVSLKAKKANLSVEEITPYLSEFGKYSPETIFEHITAGTLNRLEVEFATVYEQAEKAMSEQGVAEADLLIDLGYFELTKRLAQEVRDTSISNIVKLQIDLHNLKTRLRTLVVERFDSKTWFVSGGNLRLADIETKEQVFTALLDYGGEQHWRESIDLYTKEGHSTLIDVRADDHMLATVRNMSNDIFSPASLIAYFLNCQNSAKIIQTIIVGKEGGQSDAFIRTQLRTLYV